MLILDTNHFSEFRRGTAGAERLRQRLEASSEDAVLTIICAEETMRGWLLEIRRHQEDHRIVEAYRRFQECIEDVARLKILSWDDECAGRFRALRAQRIRIGAQDLRIASIALAHDATLLSRNLRFVPGLRVENWLD